MTGKHNHTQDFLAGGTIILLSWVQSLTGIWDHTLLTLLPLNQFCSNGRIWCICVEDKKISSIWKAQDRGWGHHFFQIFKRSLMFLCPVPPCTGPSQLIQWSSSTSHALNKFPMIIDKTQESFQVLATFWHRPLQHVLDMIIGDMYPSRSHPTSQEICFLPKQMAFPGFQLKTEHTKSGQDSYQVG